MQTRANAAKAENTPDKILPTPSLKSPATLISLSKYSSEITTNEAVRKKNTAAITNTAKAKISKSATLKAFKTSKTTPKSV